MNTPSALLPLHTRAASGSFHFPSQHVWQEGRKGTLSINEFKELVTQQLPHLLKDVGSLDEKMKSLDVNQDSELKFTEYWRLIGELAKELRKEKALEIRKK
ncbi:protein S100-A13 isoform X2 [Manis javanica]|uniref:protein S100-A13 isoform X2 n=1 Tax=Manis javanica TaxID=9974 RepID=UPI000812CEC1|nr:protein S100-A13 isoform X1 [Manis javanica]XP_036870360.1 protein S100-A13 isoform X1 [Manis javanica]